MVYIYNSNELLEITIILFSCLLDLPLMLSDFFISGRRLIFVLNESDVYS